MVRRPLIVNVTGLKKSGKTETAMALITELRARGYAVGAVKTSHAASLTLDAAGTDSRKLAEAGAAFVAALLDTETHYFERRASRGSYREASRLFPRGVRIVVCEGSVEPREKPLYVVCVKRPEDLEETLGTRGVSVGKIVAVCGPSAGASSRGASTGHVAVPLPAPLLDVRDPAQRATLADLLLDKARMPRTSRGSRERR